LFSRIYRKAGESEGGQLQQGGRKIAKGMGKREKGKCDIMNFNGKGRKT